MYRRYFEIKEIKQKLVEIPKSPLEKLWLVLIGFSLNVILLGLIISFSNLADSFFIYHIIKSQELKEFLLLLSWLPFYFLLNIITRKYFLISSYVKLGLKLSSYLTIPSFFWLLAGYHHLFTTQFIPKNQFGNPNSDIYNFIQGFFNTLVFISFVISIYLIVRSYRRFKN